MEGSIKREDFKKSSPFIDGRISILGIFYS
jgi:hypothetical protein